MANLNGLRAERAKQAPLVALPEQPGILAAMALSPSLGTHLRGIAQALLVEDFPDSTLSRGERELIATAVSSWNNCCFCADSHAAFTRKLAAKEGWDAEKYLSQIENVFGDKSGKLWELIRIAQLVRMTPLDIQKTDIRDAKEAGASNGDIQVTILIASAFCMYNRMVDGLRASTPPDAGAYEATAERIAAQGYQTA